MYLVFDIGGTAIKYCLMDDKGQIIDQWEFSSKEINDLDDFVKCIQEIYDKYKHQVVGIAFSSPGVIDANNGVIEVIVAHPYLQGVCLTEVVSKACDGIKVTVENDAKCAALAETWIGNGKEYQDIIVVVLGTGIGGAIIKNKQIHHGGHLFAGEISTVIVDYDKATKQLVTWSDIASTTALCKRVAKAIEVPAINGYQVFELANNHDQRVIDILKDFCYDIAIQLYNLQYIYDPEAILIGGGISKQPLLITMLQEAIDLISQTSNQLVIPTVNTCKYYNNANLIGALYHFLSQK